ncbi:polysaccharide deacetylase family protein [Thiothrix nivea]|uniref:Polysaccharide deacetylase n=1 Tax=Thiothrix nivea (strain ATCC 35100 / DSM 5205 / JP2) TaxID=870187 RepID=A0A656HAH0_THINJ|nr:polysaccharide deacetylase family protein [Thiothrix nivea]EIJ32844.1 polysaccharide deacetylase [Thiothrix nivea DSM 5205]
MIFSADIEDWQQSVYDFDREVSSRVLYNTSRLLDILDEHDVTGTFFVQGMVAEKFPQLVSSISRAGHELACHSHTHRRLYNLTEAQFRAELHRSVAILEDIGGEKILGFRAPTFSVREKILGWYCDALKTEGIVYDSSIMLSTVRGCYGVGDAGILQRMAEQGLRSYPMSVSRVLGKNIPVLGGGYFRIYPYWLTQWLSRNLDQESSIFYIHPYDLDSHEYREVSRQVEIPAKMAIHQFALRGSVEGKLRRLLLDYPFSSFRDTYFNPAAA